MQVGLNLATKPLISHRRFLLGSALLGLVASVLFVYLGWRCYTLRKADEAFRARMGALQEQMARVQEQRAELVRFFAKEENHNLQDRARFVGSVIEARSFNWTKMFMDLERTLPAGVHVERISPTLENGTLSVKFVVAGSSEEAKVKLLKAFEESPSFTDVELTADTAPKTGGPTADVFSVEFSAIYTGI
ncbi:MAG TPA: PilN domain-containing protein [Candidatus Sulfotelmatobacter sp.]|nr:PilN domain-containing protein [Candidatus Sulfotelmatobacter sp.]